MPTVCIYSLRQHTDRDADWPFIVTEANSSPDDHGLDSAKTIHISIRSIAAVCCELCATKANNNEVNNPGLDS